MNTFGSLLCQYFVVMFLITGCSLGGSSETLNAGLNSGITLLVQEDHWFYHKNQRNEWEGFNFELIDKIEKKHNIKFQVKLFANETDLFTAFENGQGDVMCPALSLNRSAWEKSNKHNPNDPPPQFLIELPKRTYPTVRFKVSEEEDFIWVIKEEKKVASEEIVKWASSTSSQLFLANLYEKYFAHLSLFNQFELMMLKSRYKKQLPKYLAYFEEAGKIHKIDPLFLAAMSYQESHWNPNATSFTGVRGLMMLTQNTASSLGVKNREDPQESILGGAKYLFSIKARLETEIGSPDKNYYALAAYNVGLGHVRDAQGIVKKMGQDPNLWSNLRSALPLLSHPTYYKGLKHGRARGNEPVRYVDSIRNYYSLILKLEKERKQKEG